MRFGCCANMLVPPTQGSGITVAPAVAAAGFAYIEMPVRRLAALSPDEFTAVRNRLADLGLPCETGNDFLPATVPVVGPRASREQQLTYVSGACARASALGITTVVFGSADARRRPDGVTPAQAVDQIRGFLEAIVPILRQHGITVAIEHLNQGECNTLTSLAETADLVRAINLPEIRLLADYYHLMVEHESLNQVAAHADLLAHVHVSHPHQRGYPSAHDPDLRRFLGILSRKGYDRRISIEGYSNDLATDGPAALALLDAGLNPTREFLRFQA
jgi:sugar phosphate isomerase/epimerase